MAGTPNLKLWACEECSAEMWCRFADIKNTYKKKKAARARSGGGPRAKRGRTSEGGEGEEEEEEEEEDALPTREFRGVDNAGGGLWRAIIPSTRNPSVMRNLGVFPTVGVPYRLVTS